MDYYARHPEKYSEKFRYEYDPTRNPSDEPYRQNSYNSIWQREYTLILRTDMLCLLIIKGKYDALGIMLSHEKPCSVVMDDARSHGPLVRQFIDLVQGKRLKLDDLRQAAGIINEIAKEVKQGRKFIIFPSGGYEHRNRNRVDAFKPGCFKSAMKAKAPIVPVALVDSWKVFDLWSLRKIETKVVYLKPMYYEEYKELNSKTICQIVYDRICKAVQYMENGNEKEALLQ